MNEQISYWTQLLCRSLRFNRHVLELKASTNINDMKRRIAFIYFDDGKPTESFKKGAKTIQWDIVYKFIQES